MSNEWQDVQSKSSLKQKKKEANVENVDSNNRANQVNQVNPEVPVKTAQAKKPTAYCTPVIAPSKTPHHFCINCYNVHDTPESFNSCTAGVCIHCGLELTKTHLQTKCIAAKCDRCKKMGHSVHSCKIPLCGFCGEVGHSAQECKKLEETECEKCHKLGHTKSRCPTRFVCNYCELNELDYKHRMQHYDKEIGEYVIDCENLLEAKKNGTYICPRCAYSDCYLDCKR